MSLTRRQLIAGAGAAALVLGIAVVHARFAPQSDDLKIRILAVFPNAKSVRVWERDYGFIICAAVTWADGSVTNAMAEAVTREGKTANNRIMAALVRCQPRVSCYSELGIMVRDDVYVDGLGRHA